jgi:hypothetical protein
VNETKHDVSTAPEDEPAREGGVAEQTRIDYRSNRIPVPLVIAWIVLFGWIISYVTLYMIPALPR